MSNTHIPAESGLQGTHYLLPAGKNGFIYDDAVESVLRKYQRFNPERFDEEMIRQLSSEITKAIQDFPLHAVVIDDVPIRSIAALEK